MGTTDLGLSYPNLNDPIADYPSNAASATWKINEYLRRLLVRQPTAIVPKTTPAVACSPERLEWMQWEQNVTFSNNGWGLCTPPGVPANYFTGITFVNAFEITATPPVNPSAFTLFRGVSDEWIPATNSFYLGSNYRSSTKPLVIMACFIRSNF